jgi:hypothetical protein
MGLTGKVQMLEAAIVPVLTGLAGALCHQDKARSAAGRKKTRPGRVFEIRRGRVTGYFT